MSVQALLQNDVKQVSGPNLRLLISTLPSEHTVEQFIGQLNTMKNLDEFLALNNNADGIIVVSPEKDGKRQIGFYVKQYEHMPPINEFLQRGENNLGLRERGIPINQARIKLFEQTNTQTSQEQLQSLLENFAKDFQPNNSS